MIRRIGITIVTALLAVFGIGHVRAFVTHGQFGCAVASAQQGWYDGDSGASESDNGPSDVAGGAELTGQGEQNQVQCGRAHIDTTPTMPCSADKCFSLTRQRHHEL